MSTYSYENYNSKPTTILDQTTRYNGRVNVVEPENPDARFQMYERIAIKNKATEYRESLIGEWEANALAQVFFSEGNIQILQNGLRAGVYKMSNNNFVVTPQSVDAIKVIMRSIYLQHAQHCDTDITKQVELLNQLFWNYAVPNLYNESMGYMKYLQDQSSLVVPLELPVQNDRNRKQLELKPWF